MGLTMELGIRTERATAPAGAGRDAPLPANQAAAAPPTGKPEPPTGKTLPVVAVSQAIAQIQSYLKESERHLEFQVDESSGRTVIRVVNPGSGEVIRQMPSKEFLQVAASLERSGFRLIDRQA
jgi:flagellar protein FlaG